MSFLDIVSKFNQQADSHSKSQSLNPFSEQFEHSRSPSPRFSREEYGKWVVHIIFNKKKTNTILDFQHSCSVSGQLPVLKPTWGDGKPSRTFAERFSNCAPSSTTSVHTIRKRKIPTTTVTTVTMTVRSSSVSASSFKWVRVMSKLDVREFKY